MTPRPFLKTTRCVFASGAHLTRDQQFLAAARLHVKPAALQQPVPLCALTTDDEAEAQRLVEDAKARELLPEDWDQFQILMDNALIRVPSLEKTGIKTFMNGPESFTPDLNYILGEAPQVRGFFVGAGFNSMGIASSGGAGMALAEWIVAGEPTMDLWPVDIRRFANFHGNDAWLRERVSETLGLHYKMSWPQREHFMPRPPA